jgi:hypothetical protein
MATDEWLMADLVTQSEFVSWLVAWLACMALVLWRQQHAGAGSGLVISYVLQLFVIHWLAASIYALPWYTAPTPRMYDGLVESTYGIAGFALGSAVLLPLMFKDRERRDLAPNVSAGSADPWLVHVYLGIGTFTFFVLNPLVRPIPTVNALSFAASNLLLVALGMECWNSLRKPRGEPGTFWYWVALTALLPFATIITQGFLSYGFAAMVTIFSFIASFYRPRWKLIGWSMVVSYLALSMYVTYMRDREAIREVVWAQEAYSVRVNEVMNTFRDFEFLDLQNQEHLYRIDDRLNQNGLVGQAVAYLELRPEEFAKGETIWEALLSPIPRAIWPDKPIVAGSGDLVSRFTGIRFAEGTSVGIGHILEWYVNFGSLGLFLGMCGTGLLIGWLDRTATGRLLEGDWPGFVLWYLPGLSLLQVGGSLVEAVSGASAALVVALMINRYRPQARRAVAAVPVDGRRAVS